MPRLLRLKVCNLCWSLVFPSRSSPAAYGAVEQLGVATIDPTHVDRPAPSLIADLVQVHAVKEGAFANMVNIARIGREPKEIMR